MRTEALVANQLLMAQAIFAMAEHVSGSTGYHLMPTPFDELPADPKPGMLACVSDSTVTAWGTVIAGGGSNTVLAFFDGTSWVVK